MVQYERVESYIDGRKRCNNLQNPEALSNYLQAGSSKAGSVFVNRVSLLSSSSKFVKVNTEMPFEPSGSTFKGFEFSKSEIPKRYSVVGKPSGSTLSTSLFDFIEKLKAPICVCIISKVPLFRTFTMILKKMNERASHFLQYPLEVYIKYLVSTIPIPPHGFYKISLQLFDTDKLEISFPAPNSLPICDLNFCYLAKCLSPENVMKIINFILLERHVLFISSNIELLTPVIESILALIYPFEYQLIYLPVVPYKLVDILQTTCPYILGMNRMLYKKYGSFMSASVYIVDLDKDKVRIKEIAWIEADTTLYKNQVESATMPKHEVDKAMQRIVQPFVKLKTIEDIEKSKEVKELIEIIRSAFFLIFVSIFKQQDKFIRKKNGEYRLIDNKLFETVENDYKWFIFQFKRTSIFTHWLLSRSYPNSCSKAHEHLFFEESITAKINRSLSTFFKKVFTLSLLGHAVS
jgi:hypothetical protein